MSHCLFGSTSFRTPEPFVQNHVMLHGVEKCRSGVFIDCVWVAGLCVLPGVTLEKHCTLPTQCVVCFVTFVVTINCP